MVVVLVMEVELVLVVVLFVLIGFAIVREVVADVGAGHASWRKLATHIQMAIQTNLASLWQKD